MQEKQREAYFNNESLARFVAVEGKVITKVICHLWQNNHNKTEPLEIIDNVELLFADGQKLTISCNVESNGLEAVDFDYERAAKELLEEFGGKIKLFAVDASATKMWQDVIGKTLIAVKVTKTGDYYKSDAIVLDIGQEKREISISPEDGLIIDFFED